MSTMFLRIAFILTSLLFVTNNPLLSDLKSDPDKYEKLWAEVEKFEQDALPKSALDKVEEIYILALAEKNDKQIIKSTIYRLKYTHILEEDGYEKAILKLESDLKKVDGVSKAMLHMLLASMYADYYSYNSYLINQRSVTFNFELSDLKTWDKTRFQDKIIKNFDLALNESLKSVNIEEYKEFINYATESKDQFPTLYDFVAFIAINRLSSGMGYYNYYYDYDYYGYGNQNNDRITELAYLADAKEFIKFPVVADSLSYNYAAIKLYQKWLDFRLSDEENLEALISTDIKRLQFVKSKISAENKDNLWEANLKNLHEKYYKNPELTMIDYELATYYNKLGNLYNFLDSTTHQYRLYNRKAITLLEEALKLYPKACYSPECKNLKNEIEKLSFSFETGNIVSASKNFPIRITYKNTKIAYMTILSCDYNQYLSLKKSYYEEGYIKSLLKIAKPVVSAVQINLPEVSDLNAHYTEYLVQKLPKGFYIIYLHAKPEFVMEENYLAMSQVFVSDLCLTNNNNYYKNNGYYIFDRNTGAPVENAKVEAYKYEYSYIQRDYVYTKVATENTDKNGYVAMNKIKSASYYNIRIDVSKDYDFISENSYQYYSDEPEEKTVTEVKLFTDRAIYRPGQTVFFKGICIEKTGEKFDLLTDYSTTVFLQDVNYQQIAQLQVKTNEFGSFNGSFTIPLDVLTGNFTISCYGGSMYIKVEEYKRPMFEVEMLPIEGEYRINDSVYAEGKAFTYAGTPLTDAKVTYSIFRNPLWWGYYRSSNISSKEIAFGELNTDETGKFKIGFKAIAENVGDLSDYLYYNYTISVSVTDINGETQSTSSYVYVSNKALSVSHDLYGTLLKEQLDSITISTTNISGVFVPAIVEVEIFKLEDPELLLAKKLWSDVDNKMYSQEEWHNQYAGNEYKNETDYSQWKILKSVFKTNTNTTDNKKLKLTGVNKWESGVYRVVLKSKDKWGNPIKTQSEFVLFSSSDNNMPYTATSFFSFDKYSAQPGETVTIFLGSSYKDVKILYELELKGKTVKKEILNLSSEIIKVEIPIDETFYGGATANFMFIKDGRLYSFSHRIDVPWMQKQLDLKFITFRDKTLPGSEENWKIKIKDNSGASADAEMMATLYDASLDVFAQNSWWWSIYPYYYSYVYWSMTSFSYSTSSVYMLNFYPVAEYINRYSPNFNLFGLNYYSSYYDYEYEYDRLGTDRSYKAEKGGLMPSSGAAGVNEISVSDVTTISAGEINPEMNLAEQKEATAKSFDGDDMNSREKNKNLEGPAGGKDIQIRKNFNETAFFYPTLVTDKDGEVLISFTVPESLTKWNFLGFAHTKDLKMGTINEQLVTQKELMVMPNLPRFFRENDKMTLSTKINNISEVLITGQASIEFFDPVSLKILNKEFLGDNSNQSEIKIESGKNIAVEWEIKIPEGLSAVGVRIVAVGKDHSDGEERIIPILTNRMLVTETMPLPVRKAGTTRFSMGRLKDSGKSNTLRHHRFTLEFTSNPAWYAVQALPYIMEYPYECAEQTFSRYYANILATHIANSDPKIKRVFDIWRTTPDSETLMSNLEKNQELKALMLEETPWVLEAQDENERKHRIGLLFDLNRMSMESKSALKKLEEQQLYNGGWAWFKGMPESWYITQYIVCGLGHLDNLGVTEIKNDNKTWNMTQKAIGFIDYELNYSYKQMKKYCDEKCMQEDHLGYMEIQYLYARSYFIDDVPIDKSTSEAFEYYKAQAEKYWMNKSFYMQGMIALALHRYEDKITPVKIMASLKEHSLNSEEMGMYWKNDRGYYWYQAPIETQALLIEAFDEVIDDQQSVEEMKVWLLKQKQTQDWKTTKATAEAIYALLLRGTDMLADDEIAIITVGSMKIDAANDPEIKTDAGTGYFKKAWDGSLVKPEWGDVTVSKTSNTVSWGAVYWQYFEQLDKITTFEETPLTINKKLFVERREGIKPVIVPIEKDAKLAVGDIVTVRIEIRVDRDMEYVHLKDMRASCFEPVDYLSGYRYKAGLGYYQGIKDASMNFFIDYLRKGTYVFEYELVVAQKGDFSNGITTIQCMYAPEFTSHSEGVRVVVK
ncbi:MAG TPA: alpha-2-macroglobulin family protein [Bacteroidales bacterium]|nr:alpha-2-macroglobulin family protein [Bacteroidales bacterium]